MLTLERAKETYEYHLNLRRQDSIIEKCFSESEFNKRKHNNVVAYYIVKEGSGDIIKYDLIYIQDLEDTNLDCLFCVSSLLKKAPNTPGIRKLKEGWKAEVSGDIYVNSFFTNNEGIPLNVRENNCEESKEDLQKAIQKLIDAPMMYAPYIPLQMGDTIVSDDGNTMTFHFEAPKTNFYSFDFTIPLPENPMETEKDLEIWSKLLYKGLGVPDDYLQTNCKESKEETITPDVVYRETCTRYWASEDAKWSELESWSKKS